MAAFRTIEVELKDEPGRSAAPRRLWTTSTSTRSLVLESTDGKATVGLGVRPSAVETAIQRLRKADYRVNPPACTTPARARDDWDEWDQRTEDLLELFDDDSVSPIDLALLRAIEGPTGGSSARAGSGPGARRTGRDADGDRRRLDPVVHAELVEDVGDVDARGLRADEQRLGDLGVRAARGDELEDLPLAGRQAEDLGRSAGAARASAERRLRGRRPSAGAGRWRAATGSRSTRSPSAAGSRRAPSPPRAPREGSGRRPRASPERAGSPRRRGPWRAPPVGHRDGRPCLGRGQPGVGSEWPVEPRPLRLDRGDGRMDRRCGRRPPGPVLERSGACSSRPLRRAAASTLGRRNARPWSARSAAAAIPRRGVARAGVARRCRRTRRGRPRRPGARRPVDCRAPRPRQWPAGRRRGRRRRSPDRPRHARRPRSPRRRVGARRGPRGTARASSGGRSSRRCPRRSRGRPV